MVRFVVRYLLEAFANPWCKSCIGEGIRIKLSKSTRICGDTRSERLEGGMSKCTRTKGVLEMLEGESILKDIGIRRSSSLEVNLLDGNRKDRSGQKDGCGQSCKDHGCCRSKSRCS